MSIGKRVAGIGAAVAIIATVGPVSLAGASTVPTMAPPSVASPFIPPAISGAYQAGADAAIGGWNAGADAAIGGLNAGAAVFGLPYQLTMNTSGPLGLHTASLAPIQ
ncbi:MAG TPA: hypothetical protein VK501_24610 [Baekduia sp.]|nr:hypothetical protein [Baekduia sp.]